VPYRIVYARAASLDLAELAARERATVGADAPRYLADQPAVASSKRTRMEPNPLGADWEPRLGPLRVYDDTDEPDGAVRVLRVGEKVREREFIRGRVVDLREER
jgi:hypothetical protein